MANSPGVSEQLECTMQAAREAVAWMDEIEAQCKAGACAHSLNTLIRVGSEHLVVAERFMRAVDSTNRQLGRGPEARTEFPLSARTLIEALPTRIKDWRAAAADATARGLNGGHVLHNYWQKNIALPDALTIARKWFATADRVIAAGNADSEQVVKFASTAAVHLAAVEACRSSWPRARRMSIQRCFLQWKLWKYQWDVLGFTLPRRTVEAQTKGRFPDQAKRLLDEINGQVKDMKKYVAEQVQALKEGKECRRAMRAHMLMKRTCSHCGTTGPLSQVSFAYCGGCRDSRVARIYWARYCSEACQRAHWAAGHKDECPCGKDL